MRYILAAIAKATWRDIRSLQSVQGTNFFWFVALISMQPQSALFLWLLMFLLFAIPILTAPFAQIPRLRLDLWPAATPKILLWFARPSQSSSPRLWRLLPTLELRQFARTLDVPLAALLALSATIFARQDPAARTVMSLVVTLALSSLANNLFAHDQFSGRLRWRLLPIPGYRLLLRKGAPLLALNLLLTAPLDPLAATTGMLAALAIGHHNSVLGPLDASPWRFTASSVFPHGVLQCVALFGLGVAASRGESYALPLAAGAYLISLALYGWAGDHH
jgi:hypothetical protein